MVFLFYDRGFRSVEAGAPAPKKEKPVEPEPKPSTPPVQASSPPSTPPPTQPPAAAAPPPTPAKGSAETKPIKTGDVPVAAIKHAQSLESATVKIPPQDPTSEITGTRTEQRVKMNRMRLRIAQRLKDAQNTTAMLTTFNEIDMRYLMILTEASFRISSSKEYDF